MTATVNRVVRADAGTWLEMRAALWPDCDESEHRREIEQFFAGGANEPLAVLLARAGHGQPVGFVELSIRAFAEGCRTDRVAYVEGWYVVPGARGGGVGRVLMEAAEDWGRSRGCSELASDAEADDEISRQAHGALGFEDVGLVRCFRKALSPEGETGA